MRLSVVIPTWNEELWLPRLLKSLRQIGNIDEIFVLDNESEDATVSVAKASGCTVATGGRPAKGRNVGARMCSGDIVIFIDADAVLEKRVIEGVERHFSSSEVVAVHCRLAPIRPTLFIRFCYAFMDWYVRLVSRLGIHQGAGSFVAVRKSAFLSVGGFRERVEVGEDADFFRRLGELGVIRYDRDLTVYVSPRRFFVEVPVVFAAKVFFWGALRLSSTTASIIGYKWTAYPRRAAEREEPFVRELLAY